MKLFKNAEISKHARFYTLSSDDDRWQSWVTEHLHRCSAVLIDISVDSDGLKWELDRSQELVSRERILVLQEIGSKLPIPSQVCSILYLRRNKWDKESKDPDRPGPGQIMFYWFDEMFVGRAIRRRAWWTIIWMFLALFCATIGIWFVLAQSFR